MIIFIIKITGDTNFTTRNKLISNEQYYLDLLNPPYNILKKAYNSMGFKFKHSEEAIAKIKAFRNNSQNLSHKIYLYDLNKNLINTFVSIAETARNFNVPPRTIYYYVNKTILKDDTKQKIFRKKFLLLKKKIEI